MSSLFDDDGLARQALEELRWPNGPRCAHCNASGTDVFMIGGQKQSHRDGLYHCKLCRRQFTVTLGTVFERSRITLSAWMRAAHAFSTEPQRQRGAKTNETLTPLRDLALEIGISYKTVLRVRDIIKQAAKHYKGNKTGFGAWPRSFMKSRAPRLHGYHKRRDALLAAGKHPWQHTIKATGVLVPFAHTHGATEAALKRTECLLRLLLVLRKSA